jgi:hypothetical protein
MPIARIVTLIVLCAAYSAASNAKTGGEIDSGERPPDHECDYYPVMSIRDTTGT